jgi:hypothetical protein
LRSIKNAYYRIHKEGKKEIITGKYGQQYGEGEMVEQKESFSGTIERLVDKVEKNAMIKKNVLLKPDANKYMRDRFNLSDTGVKKFNDWIENEDNHEELRYFFELVLTVLKPKSEADICQYDSFDLGKKITSAKKDPHLIKAKEIIEHVIIDILGNQYNSHGKASLHRARQITSTALMTYLKLMLCKSV